MEKTSPQSRPIGGDFLDRFVRLVRWTIINGLLAWCAWEAVGNESVGAGRVLAFTAWLFGPLAILCACSPDARKKIAAKGRSVPAWLSHGYGIPMIAILVWNGWWMTAIGMLLMEIGEATVYSEPNAQDEPRR